MNPARVLRRQRIGRLFDREDPSELTPQGEEYAETRPYDDEDEFIRRAAKYDPERGHTDAA